MRFSVLLRKAVLPCGASILSVLPGASVLAQGTVELPAGLHVAAAFELNFSLGDNAAGTYWRDLIRTPFVRLGVSYDGAEAGGAPIGFELAYDARFPDVYKSGTLISERDSAALTATVWAEGAAGRLTVGRGAPMVLDYVSIPSASSSAAYLSLRNTSRFAWGNAVRRGTPGDLPGYWTARYDSPWMAVGNGGRLRFGAEAMELTRATTLASYYPTGTRFVTLAGRYESDNLDIGASYWGSTLAGPSGSFPAEGYDLSAQYRAGDWTFGAGIAGNLYEKMDLATVQASYAVNDRLRLGVTSENYLYRDGSTSYAMLGGEIRYQFDNGLYAGIATRRDLSGAIGYFREDLVFAGWELATDGSGQ